MPHRYRPDRMVVGATPMSRRFPPWNGNYRAYDEEGQPLGYFDSDKPPARRAGRDHNGFRSITVY
jgi:hypothetical protein